MAEVESLSFRQRLALAGKALVGVFSSDASSAAFGMLSGISLGRTTGEPPNRGTKDFLQAYSTMPWLRAVTTKVANSIASVQWQLFIVRKNGKPERNQVLQRADIVTRERLLAEKRHDGELEEVVEHPLLNLLHSANPFIDGLSARKLTQVYIDLVGEAFWIKERNAFGIPVAIWPVPPSWVTETPTPQRRSFVLNFRSWRGEIPDTEILWFCDPNPENPYGRGSGTARSLADELETDEYAAKHTKAWFYNKARPDLIISADGLQKDETARMEQDWLNKHQGFWRSFKPHFVNRKLDVQVISQEFRNMQLIELRKHERDTIVQVFGVPPELIGILTSSNRATIDAADFLFSRWVLLPRLEFLRSVMQTRLVPEYDERLILSFVSPIAEDKAHQLNAAKAAPWSLSADEWRRLQGHKPMENDAGDVHMVPMNLVPTKFEGLAIGPRAPDPMLESLESKNGNVKVNGQVKQELPVDLDLVDDESYELTHVVANKLQRRMENVFLVAVRQARLDMDVQAFENAFSGTGTLQIAIEAIPVDGFEEKMGDAENVLQAAFTAAGEGAIDVLFESAPEVEELSIDDSVSKQEVTFAFDVVNPRSVEWIQDNTARLVRDVTAETRRGIAEVVERSFVQGGTPDVTARRIRGMIGLNQAQVAQGLRLRETLTGRGITGVRQDRLMRGFVRKKISDRATTIARTEMIAAANGGQMELWKQAKDDRLIPLNSGKKWITTPDDRADPNCLTLDGEEAPINVAFSQGIDHPPLHPMCRCAMRLVQITADTGGGRFGVDRAVRTNVDDNFDKDEIKKWAEASKKKSLTEDQFWRLQDKIDDIALNVTRAEDPNNSMLRMAEIWRGTDRNSSAAVFRNARAWNGSPSGDMGFTIRAATQELWGGQLWRGGELIETERLRASLRVSLTRLVDKAGKFQGTTQGLPVVGRLSNANIQDWINIQKRWVQARYEVTQRILQTRKIKKIKLKRGMFEGTAAPRDSQYSKLLVQDPFIQAKNGTATSYSDKLKVARDFGSFVYEMEVPAENIMGWYKTGFGVVREGEYVILGDKTQFKARVLSTRRARRDAVGVTKQDVAVITEDPDSVEENQEWLQILRAKRDPVEGE